MASAAYRESLSVGPLPTQPPCPRPVRGGSVGRAAPTRAWRLQPAGEGRSVGSFRPEIFFAALRAAAGRSGETESETQKSHFLGRSVGDAKGLSNFAPPNRSGRITTTIRGWHAKVGE